MPPRETLAPMASLVTNAPTGSPTNAPALTTPAPVSRERRMVPGITVVFTQSQQMSDGSVFVFEDIVTTWFNAYYNGRRRRESRRLQAVAGIQNMDSQIEVMDQTVSNVANIITFTQMLNYDATAVANETATATELVLAPWNDTAYNGNLAELLTQMLPDIFGSLRAPIPVPTIVETSGTTEDGDSKSKDSSTNPALYSLAALALIPIVGVVAYFVYRKRSSGTRSENAGEPVSVAAMRQTEDPPGYLPEPKDQCRDVPLENRGDDPPLATAVAMDKESTNKSVSV